MRKNLKSKRIQGAIVILIAAAVVLTGAFAWYSFNQERTNTFRVSVAPNVNLHDDFAGGPEKDVYVENSGDHPVLVRVRLTELLIRDGVILPDGAIDNEDGTNWHPHNPLDDECEVCDFAAHEYLTWTMDGHKFFMPAPDSAKGYTTDDGQYVEPRDVGDLDAIIDYAALLRNAFADDATVLGYIDEYLSGDSTNTAELQAAIEALPDSVTVPDVRQYDWQPEDELTRKLNEVRLTLIPTQIMTMESWINGGYPTGDFWVVDTDGWCYWASALQPKTATGQLLSNVEYKNVYDGDELTYRINVILNATTFAESELEDFFELAVESGGISENGKLLMMIISGGYEERYFHHIGNGVYVEVAEKDGTESKDAPVTYYFAGEILNDGGNVTLSNLGGDSVEAKVSAEFNLQLTVGEGFDLETDENGRIIGFNLDGDYYTMVPLEEHESNWYIKIGEDGYIGADAAGNLGGGAATDLLETPGSEVIALPKPSGDGSQANPFKIRSRYEMDWLTNQVNNKDINFAGQYLEVVKDFSMGGKDFLPIGSEAKSFMGTFDGGGFTISDLKITSSSQYNGLFGYIGGGSVKNLTLENADVKGYGFTGGIAGRSFGTIEDCSVSGKVYGSANNAGGITGMNHGKISNCDFTGDVIGDANNDGGIVGYNNGTVEGCTVSGTVTGTATNPNSGNGTCVGGIAGFNSGIVRDCLNNDAKVVSAVSSVGGVVGYNTGGTVIRCENTGEVESAANSVGGIVGSNIAAVSKITDCSNSGKVTGTGDNVGGAAGVNEGTVTGCFNSGVINGNANVSGILGLNYGTVSGCGNSGEVSGNANVGGAAGFSSGMVQLSYSTGDISGTGYAVGGVVGRLGKEDGSVPGTLTNCYAWGNVTSETGCAGGVAGVVGYNSTATYVYHANGTVMGLSYGSGGIAGLNSSVISNAVALAVEVKKNTGTGENADVGRVAGRRSGTTTVTEVYASSSMTIGTEGFYAESGVDCAARPTQDWWSGTAKFNFTNIWSWDSGSGLPVLTGDKPDGSASDPYTISTRADLEWLSSAVSSGDTFEGKHFELANDIDMGSTAFTTIGSDTKKFAGHFDGGNQTISNLKVTGESSTALFASIGADGVVQNLTLANANISGVTRASGIAGYNLGRISGCSVVDITVTGTYQYAGGIVGYNDAIVENCTASGSISGVNYTGGIAGSGSGIISGSSSSCTVNSTHNAGGITGAAHNANVSGCTNTGNITGAWNNVGGVVGNMNAGSTVKGCTNSGTVTGNDNVGGIAGSNNGTVSGCTNTGTPAAQVGAGNAAQ